MQFSNGVKPNTTRLAEYIEDENNNYMNLFDGTTGINESDGIYYIIGTGVFLEYPTLAAAKEDWFGKTESDMYEELVKDGNLLFSRSMVEHCPFEDYFYEGLYYRVWYTREMSFASMTCTPYRLKLVTYLSKDEIELPWLPASLSIYTFPRELDCYVAAYCDDDLYAFFMQEGTVRKTLFCSVEERVSPIVNYVVELHNEFFLANAHEGSIEGRYSSMEMVLLSTDYMSLGKEPCEKLDYVKVLSLDREPDDENLFCIEEEDLCAWMEENARYHASFAYKWRMGFININHIYEFLDGFFVLDPYESSVMGKFTSQESAYTGAKDAYDSDRFALYDD